MNFNEFKRYLYIYILKLINKLQIFQFEFDFKLTK